MIQTPPQRSNLEVLRAKIIEAVPEKACPIEDEGNHCASHSLGLADVLRAIENQYAVNGLVSKDDWGVSIGNYWVASLLDPEQKSRWNLAVPLELQPQPVIDFLTTILV